MAKINIYLLKFSQIKNKNKLENLFSTSIIKSINKNCYINNLI